LTGFNTGFKRKNQKIFRISMGDVEHGTRHGL